jgi:hypothetical protein
VGLCPDVYHAHALCASPSLLRSEDGAFFVTCGERHIKFWPMVGGEGSAKGGHELPALAPPSPEVMDKVPVLSGAAAR